MSLIIRCTDEGGKSVDEIELVKKVQDGDMKAFEELFEKYKYQAMRTAYLITGNKDLSEDILQEAFVQCYLSIKKLKKPEEFKSWFFRTLTRIAWRQGKREKKLMAVGERVEKTQKLESYNPIEAFHQDESAKELYQNIAKLEDKHRITLVLYYYNELSIKEISHMMGCLEGTVKSRLYMARKKLKKTLEGLNDEKIYSHKRGVRNEKIRET